MIYTLGEKNLTVILSIQIQNGKQNGDSTKTKMKKCHKNQICNANIHFKVFFPSNKQPTLTSSS